MRSPIINAFATFAVAVTLGVGGLGSLCIVGGHALTSQVANPSSIQIAYAAQPSMKAVSEASNQIASNVDIADIAWSIPGTNLVR